MIFSRLRVPFDIHGSSSAGVSAPSSAAATRSSETICRRGGREVRPVVSQSVVTSVSSAMSEISSTRNFRVPARDLESLLASRPIRRATSLWLTPAFLMAQRTRSTSACCALCAPSSVVFTTTVCTGLAILARVTGVLVSYDFWGEQRCSLSTAISRHTCPRIRSCKAIRWIRSVAGHLRSYRHPRRRLPDTGAILCSARPPTDSSQSKVRNCRLPVENSRVGFPNWLPRVDTGQAARRPHSGTQ